MPNPLLFHVLHHQSQHKCGSTATVKTFLSEDATTTMASAFSAIVAHLVMYCFLIWLFHKTWRALTPPTPQRPLLLTFSKSYAKQLSFITFIATAFVGGTVGTSVGSYYVYRRDPFGMQMPYINYIFTCFPHLLR